MKNYLVIGGSSGIGLRTAELLVKAGNNTYASYHTTLPDGSEDGINYFLYNVLSNDTLTEQLPDKLHGLVYCPGAIVLKPFSRIKPADFIEDYSLQVVGAVKAIQAALPKLKNAEGSSVVMVSSVAAQTGFNFHSLVSASKGAIEGLTLALAAEFAPLIRVNCIAPSLSNTPLAGRLLSTAEKTENNAQRHPLKRIGSAEDSAQAIKYLLSPDSGWITGQVLKVDGGISSIRM